MKSNRKGLIILTVIAVILLTVAFAACNKGSSTTTSTTEAHTHTLVHHVAAAAGCESVGNAEYWYCTTCEKYYADETGDTETTLSALTIAATGHTLTGEWIPKVEATCTTAGKMGYRVCTTCSRYLDQSGKTIGDSEEDLVIAALGHSLTHYEAVEATCTEAGNSEYRYCSRCEECFSYESGALTIIDAESVVIAALGHNLSYTAAVAATCTQAGHYEYWYCDRCECYFADKNYTPFANADATVIAALGHTAGDAVQEKVVAATCKTGGSYDSVVYCTVCGAEVSRATVSVNALDHTAGSAVQEKVVAATCTEEGSYDSVVYCSLCGEELSREGQTIDALGHLEAVKYENVTENTCLEGGSYDYVIYCSRCGYEWSRTQRVVTVIGHTAGSAVRENVTPATCTEEGSYDSVVYCVICSEELSRKESVIAALGHEYLFDSYVWDTSTAGAYTAKAKLVCQNDASHVTYEDVEVSVITTAASCTSAGVRTYTASYGEYSAATVTEPLPQSEHAFGALTAAITATCTTDGNYAYYYCSSCECYYGEEGDYLGDTINDVMIYAYGHNYSDTVAAVSPTCTTTGTRAYCLCSGCQSIFVYEDGAYTKVNESDLVVAATGHTYSAMTAAVAATCTEEGNVAYCTCSVCGKYFNEDYEEISVGDIAVSSTGHTYANGVCSVCGAVQGSLTISTEDGNYSYVKTDGYEVYTLSSAGSYYISGAAEYAQIYVDAGEEDQVYLYLNGVSVTNAADSVIYVNNADKVYLVAVSGTINTLSDTRSASGTYDNGSAAVYSTCDLNITKDSGTLLVTSTYKNGIHTKKDLTVKKVNLTVTAVNDALKGEKSIEIGSNATVTAVSSNGDGLKTSDNGLKSSGAQEGTIDIQGGIIYIYANRDGIDAAYDVTISGSTTAVYVYTGDYATTKTGAAAVAGESAKGIKAENNIYLADATIAVKAEEDGIHANAGTLESGSDTEGNVTIYGGTITVELAKDDGIAADGAVTVEGGVVTVDSYDNGITGSEVLISDGTVTVHSYSGDGIKSSSGDVTVTGGTVSVYAAYDGITGNNSVNVSGSSTSVTVYTATYSSYTDTSVSSDAYLALSSTSSSYWYAVYFYNSSTDYAWVTPSYKTYESPYYYYKFRSYASDYTYFTVYRFTSSVTEPSTSSYSAKTSALTSSSYFTSSYNALKLSVSSSTISVTKSAYASDSTKGIKSYNEINISGGTVYIKSYDDAIHANNDNGAGTVTISGGNFTVYTMDQGILADYSATISGGTVNITYAREGIQAVYLYFKGGTTTIYAYDDGINASKGTTSYTPCIYVYDGATLDVTVPSGDTDGIDSNGNYTQTGGTVITRDATSDTSGNMSGFDIDGTCTITGGIFVCAGTPAELPSSSSQCYVKFSCGSSGMGGGGMSGGGPGGRPGSSSSSSSSSSTSYPFASGTWQVKNSSGTTLFSFTLGTTYKGLWMSYSGFTTGSTYTITNGSTTYSWTQSSRATTVG